MKRVTSGLVAFAALLATAGVSHAVDAEAGTARAGIMSLLTGARPAAMGGAFTAVADDVNAAYHNPAGLGFLKASEFAANQTNGFADFNMSDVIVAIPLGDVTASNVRQLGTLTFNIGTLDYGSQTAVNNDGNLAGSLNANDTTLALGWGKAIGTRVAVGLVGRRSESEIFRVKDTITSFDAGLLFKVVPGVFNVGLAGTDMGSDNPTEYKGGIALMPAGDRVILSAEGGTAEDRSTVLRAGAEFRPASALALRVGYDDTFDAGSGLSFGAGFMLIDFEVGFFPLQKVALDYAFTPADDLEAFHRISLSARIGTQ